MVKSKRVYDDRGAFRIEDRTRHLCLSFSKQIKNNKHAIHFIQPNKSVRNAKKRKNKKRTAKIAKNKTESSPPGLEPRTFTLQIARQLALPPRLPTVLPRPSTPDSRILLPIYHQTPPPIPNLKYLFYPALSRPHIRTRTPTRTPTSPNHLLSSMLSKYFLTLFTPTASLQTISASHTIYNLSSPVSHAVPRDNPPSFLSNLYFCKNDRAANATISIKTDSATSESRLLHSDLVNVLDIALLLNC